MNSEGQELLGRLPEDVATICFGATSPLEIAAGLEARGVSSRIAREEFGEPDVFALARRLFDDVPRRAERASSPGSRPKPGGIRDLLRGAMFAAPTLLFGAAVEDVRLRVPAWPYLLALVAGWTFSQAVAGLGVRVRDSGRLALLCLVGSGLVSLLIALGVEHFRGGGGGAVLVVVTIVCYIVSLAVLLLKSRGTRLVAAPLIPSVALALVLLVFGHRLVPRGLTAGAALGCVSLTVLAALWTALRAFHKAPKIEAIDLARAWRCSLHGLACGLVTVWIIELSAGTAGASPPPVACYPVLVTLGVMEWQLRSFQSRADSALRTAGSSREVQRALSSAFAISLSIYLAALFTACSLAALYLHAQGHSVPIAVLGAELFLGTAFFAGLVAAACGDLRSALWGDCAGGAVVLALFAGWRLSGHLFQSADARITCLIAITAAAAVAISTSQRTVRSAFSHL